MLIAMDPSQTFELTLDFYKQQPEESRPIFVCRFLTCRQVLKFEQLIAEAGDKRKDQEGANRLLNEALGLAVVGWKNVSSDFSIDALSDVLTPREKWELAFAIPGEVVLAESNKKKSISPSASDGAAAPANAQPAASAQTNQAP